MPQEGAGTRRNSRYGRFELSCLLISSSSSKACQTSLIPISLVADPEPPLFPAAGRGPEDEDALTRGEGGDVAGGDARGLLLVEVERHREEAAAERRQPERAASRRHHRHAVRHRRALDALAPAQPRLPQ